MRTENKLYLYPYSPLFIIVVSLILSARAQAQITQRYNRVQYHKLHWRCLHTKDFHIYFPIGNDSLCSFIARGYPQVMEKVSKRMAGGLQKEPNIVIYPSVDQLYESNIGSFNAKEYTLPTFVGTGNRIMLFFTGSYTDLTEQLQEAIARSIWEEYFRKNDLTTQAKDAVKDDPIPQWFREGAIRYFAQGWTIKAEDALWRSFDYTKFSSWQQVIGYEPCLSGQAFCYFLSKKYYKQSVTSLFFQLKKKKQLSRAIRLIAKKPLDSLYIECLDFYRNRFAVVNRGSNKYQTALVNIPHKDGIITKVQISKDGQKVAYILNTYCKRKVYCYNVQTKTTNSICKYLLPPWVGDHSPDIYPVISWNSKEDGIVVAQPVKGKITIRNFGIEGTEIENLVLNGVDGLSTARQLGYRQYLLSAYKRGQSDIVVYDDSKEKYTPFTNDVFDDIAPVADSAGDQIAFVSIRPVQKEKLKGSVKVVQGIFTIRDREISPLYIDSIPYILWDKPVWLKNNGIFATHTIFGDERFALVKGAKMITLSEYAPFQYLPQADEISFFRDYQDTIRIVMEPMQKWIAESTTSPSDTTSPWLDDYRAKQAEQAKEDTILARAKGQNPSVLEDVFNTKSSKQNAEQKKDSTHGAEEYTEKKVKPYILQLHKAYFTAKVNNDYFINRYQPYLNYQGQFKFPGVGGMVQGGIADLFENHHFKISYRLPAGSEGSDFFIQYKNTARKVDWGLTYFRKVESLKPDPNRNWVDEFGRQYPGTAKVKTFYYDVSVHYPLSYDCSLGLVEAVRNDRTIFLATNKYSLEFEDIKSVWSITTLSGEVNKLRPTLPNLFKGFKGNAAVDVFKGFSQEEALVFGSTLHIQYHQPLYRYITLVIQGQGGYSAGDQKVLYTFGGVDNNVTPKVDSTVRFSQTAPYAFQSLVAPFRGYLQNSTYGNRYMLFSADVYFPIFQTLIPIETPLPSINNIQLGMFSDAASAKETWTANPNNGKWLYSYGLSARTSLAGYPLRFDIAWPGSFSKKPVWYLSLNLK